MAVRQVKGARPTYQFEGGAAYDINRRPIEQPNLLPEERQAPKRARRVRARMQVSLGAVLGIAAIVFLAVLVIFDYVQSYELTRQVASLNRELSTLQEEQAKLQNAYEDQLDLGAVEAQAKSMGMTQPRAGQTVYLNLSSEDYAEISQPAHTNFFTTVYHAIRDSVLGLLEYLS